MFDWNDWWFSTGRRRHGSFYANTEPGKTIYFSTFCYSDIPTLVKFDMQPWTRQCWSNEFVYIGYANIFHKVCQEMKLSLFSWRHCGWAPLFPSLSFSLIWPFCSLSSILSDKCTHKHKHAALPFSNISCPLPVLWLNGSKRRTRAPHGKTSLFRFPFFILHKDILFQKTFHQDSCVTPIGSGQNGGNIAFYISLFWLRVFFFFVVVDLSMRSACLLWFVSTVSQQVEQCALVLGVSDSIQIPQGH